MKNFLLILAFMLGAVGLAQPGSVDPTFNPSDLGYGLGDGPDGDVYSMVTQPDGRILIGGQFATYNGVERNGIARLLADGTVDTSFDPGSGTNGQVTVINLQEDGTILIGGSFSSYNGTARPRIARLLPNGSLDTSFDPEMGASNMVTAIETQPDGRIFIGGSFNHYNNVVRNKIARLHANGQLDISFDPGEGIQQGFVSDLALDADGRLLIAGSFIHYDDVASNHIARANADGSLDMSFAPGASGQSVRSVHVLPDGKILIGGSFSTLNGIERNNIARLTVTGAIDASFDPGLGPNDIIWSIVPGEDGTYLVGGSFFTFNGTPRMGLALVNNDGSLNNAFGNYETNLNDIRAISLLEDGKALIAGSLFDNWIFESSRFARVNADGTTDTTFNPCTGADLGVECIAIQPDGKSVIGGLFTAYNGTPRMHIARLNSDGGLDPSFDPGSGANIWVRSILLQPDGRMLVGGGFTMFNDVPVGGVVRLTADGGIDPSFNAGSGVITNGLFDQVNTMAMQADGKFILGGNFNMYNGTPASHLVRIHPDGTLDETFDIGSGPTGEVLSVVIQPDGKILVGGEFNGFDGIPHNCLTRLESNGAVDPSFQTGTGANSVVRSIALQSDGKIVAAGYFNMFNSAMRPGITRLLENGSLDPDFQPATGGEPDIYSAVIQPDGQIVIAGFFQEFQGVIRRHIARINTDGSLDTSFDPGEGANSGISALALQPDGLILVGGYFTAYNGTGRNRMARILGGSAQASVHETAPELLGIGPNPVVDQLMLKQHDGHPLGTVSIHQSDGREVQRMPPTSSNELVLDVRALPAGTHVVVSRHNGALRSVRFVKH